MTWLDAEMEAINLGDSRLNKKAKEIAKNFFDQPDKSIYSKCNGEAELKSAYRFFANDKVTPEKILNPHLDMSIKRAENLGTVYLIQDTTALDFTKHHCTEGLLPLARSQQFDQSLKGFFLHIALLVDEAGVPLGTSYFEFFGNKTEKRSELQKKKPEYKSVPIEEKKSFRWLNAINNLEDKSNIKPIHICDREADIFEFIQLVKEKNQDFVVRMCQDRRITNSKLTIKKTLSHQTSFGKIELEIYDRKKRKYRKSIIDLKAAAVNIRPPQRLPGAKKNKLEEQTVYALKATEVTEDVDSNQRVEWYLLTSLPINNAYQAVNVLNIYKKRWIIEDFFKVLKTCFRVENARLASGSRLKNFIALNLVLAYRLLFLTKVARNNHKLSTDLFFRTEHWKLICSLSPLYKRTPSKPPALPKLINALASLGGYLARRNDPPPGYLVLCRGLIKFNNALEGTKSLGLLTCG